MTFHDTRTADIGVIGAMQIEVESLITMLDDRRTETISGIDFITGTLHGKRIVTAKCGIGKVFAAICAQTMILCFHPAVIINSGVAGTLTNRLSIGQVALADRVAQHDMDTSALGDPLGLLSGINQVYLPADQAVVDALERAVASVGVPFLRGTIVSGDQFICKSADRERIHRVFDLPAPEGEVIACEMEAASIGQVCYVNRVPYGILRAISDGGDENASFDYPTFLISAAHTATGVIVRFIEDWKA